MSAAPHQHRLAVGIDLGTTNSLVATVRNGIAVVLNDENGRSLLPSIVRYKADGGVDVGYAAQGTQASDPRNTSSRRSASWDAASRTFPTSSRCPTTSSTPRAWCACAPSPG